MAASPIPVLIIIVLTLTFEAALFGEELAESSFPTLNQPTGEDCAGFIDGIACALKYFINVFRLIFGVVVFFFNLVVFNIPGAPLVVKVVVGTAITGALVWSLASLIRGN